jgi:hypothetical protein
MSLPEYIFHVKKTMTSKKSKGQPSRRPKKEGQVTKRSLLGKYSHFLNDLSSKMHAQAGGQPHSVRASLAKPAAVPNSAWRT